MNSPTQPNLNQEGNQLRSVTLSEARHDLANFPKYFQSNSEPLLIEHHGQPVMALMGMDVFMMSGGAVQFIAEMNLNADFQLWMQKTFGEEGAESSGESSTQGAAAEGDGTIEDPNIRMRAVLAEKIKNEPEFREEFLNNLQETKTWVESLLVETTQA